MTGRILGVGLAALIAFAAPFCSPISCSPALAQGLFGGGNKLDTSFCKEHNIRQTVIYVDDGMLVTGQNGWLQEIYDKLTATLVPGERTTLVELSPATGRSTERWSGCWPAYSPAEAAKLSSGIRIFSANPLTTVKQQQGFFGRDLGVAVAQIAAKQARSEDQVVIDPENPPQQSIIRALASDGARYAHSQETVRAILYSNLAENSDLGSVFASPPQPVPDLGTKLGTFLRRSVFYVFGTGADIKGNGHLQDAIRSFWVTAFQSMAANVDGIGTDLSIPNIVPVSASNFDVLLKHGGDTLTGRLSLLTGSDGSLVDSWLGIVRLRTSALNGTFNCRGAAKTPSCSLQATTTDGIVTTSASETLTLTSRNSTALTGTIGVPGSSVNLPLAAAPAEE